MLTDHTVKPAGASCDFMRVLALRLSPGNAQVVMPTSSPLHPCTRLAKPAFSVSSHELFCPAVDVSVLPPPPFPLFPLTLSFRRCSLFLQNWARDSLSVQPVIQLMKALGLFTFAGAAIAKPQSLFYVVRLFLPDEFIRSSYF